MPTWDYSAGELATDRYRPGIDSVEGSASDRSVRPGIDSVGERSTDRSGLGKSAHPGATLRPSRVEVIRPSRDEGESRPSRSKAMPDGGARPSQVWGIRPSRECPFQPGLIRPEVLVSRFALFCFFLYCLTYLFAYFFLYQLHQLLILGYRGLHPRHIV